MWLGIIEPISNWAKAESIFKVFNSSKNGKPNINPILFYGFETLSKKIIRNIMLFFGIITTNTNGDKK